MSKQYFIVELIDLDAEETRIEVERGANYAVGVLEQGVIRLVDYSYRSPDEARQAWPQLGVMVIEAPQETPPDFERSLAAGSVALPPGMNRRDRT